jgi:glycosyltransferase involved in cell wall biosynthesis
MSGSTSDSLTVSATTRASRLRVLIVSLSTYTAKQNHGALNHLAQAGHNLWVVSGRIASMWGQPHDLASNSLFRVELLPVSMKRSPALAHLAGVRHRATKFRPDLIHIDCEPWQPVAFQAVYSAQRLGVPVGIQFAENGPRLAGWPGRIRRTMARALFRQCSYAIGWAADSSDIALALAPNLNVHTFPATGSGDTSEPMAPRDPVWPSNSFPPHSSGVPLRLTFVGRLEEEKGIGDFLRLCDYVQAKLPLEAVVIGAGGQLDVVERWTLTRPWLTHTGVMERSDVRRVLSASDGLVCPSRTTKHVKEQFGKAAAEALSVGTPVFAYDCGALREVVGGGGYVVREGDLCGLGDAIIRYSCTPHNQRRELAALARAQGGRFTDEAVASQLGQVWHEVVGESRLRVAHGQRK